MSDPSPQSKSRVGEFAREAWATVRAVMHGPCGAVVVMAWVCGEMAKAFRRQVACLWRFFWRTTRISWLVLKPLVVLSLIHI